MTTDSEDFEKKVISLVEVTLAQHRESLNTLGLKPHVKDIRRGKNISTYWSEAEIWFEDLKKINHGHGDLADVLEFFIFNNGKPAASLQEFSSWFEENLLDVLSRRKQQLLRTPNSD